MPHTPHTPRHLRPSGGYRNLRCFQLATIIYDATEDFCRRFVDPRSRTNDQMIQAARSGRQNIAEGSRAAAVSSQTELRLISVARSSLDELLLDYEDFLRQQRRPQWRKDDTNTREIRQVRLPADVGDDLTTLALPYHRWLTSDDPAVIANALICLIHVANYLLDQLIASLERDFVQQGGYTEQLATARLAERQRQQQSSAGPSSNGWPTGATPADHGVLSPATPSKPSNLPPANRANRTNPSNVQSVQTPNPSNPSNTSAAPLCPQCHRPLVLRTARKGAQAGSQFWGCSGYPQCKGTLPLSGSV